MLRTSWILYTTILAYIIFDIMMMILFINPFIVLKNNYECMKHISYSAYDKDVIKHLYFDVTIEWLTYGLSLLFLLIDMIIFGKQIYLIILLCTSMYSMISMAVSIYNIIRIKEDISTIIKIPVECYEFVPDNVHNMSFTYGMLCILSTITIIFCALTMVGPVILSCMEDRESELYIEMLRSQLAIPLNENNTEEVELVN